MNLKLWLRRACQRLPHDAGGQAMVELALVAPILLLMVVGVMEFGRAWNAYQVITDAAREAARQAVVDNPSTQQEEIREIIGRALARAALEPDSAEVDFTGWRTGRDTPAAVSIAYPYQFTFLSRLLRAVGFPSSVTLRTQFVMRNE